MTQHSKKANSLFFGEDESTNNSTNISLCRDIEERSNRNIILRYYYQMESPVGNKNSNTEIEINIGSTWNIFAKIKTEF